MVQSIVKTDEKRLSVKITEYEKSYDKGILDGQTFYIGVIETDDYFKVEVVHENYENLKYVVRTFGKFDDATVGNFTDGDVLNYLYSTQFEDDLIEFYTAFIKRDGYGDFEGRVW